MNARKKPQVFSAFEPESLQKSFAKHSWVLQYLGGPIEKRWPQLERTGLLWPAHHTHDMVNWVWLCWHSQHDYAAIQVALRQHVRQALALYRRKGIKQSLREAFDYFMVQVAVLAGDVPLTKEVLDCVRIAQAGSKRYQHYEAWCGIISGVVRDDPKLAQKQFRLFSRWKPMRW